MRFDHDAHSLGFQNALERIADFLPQPFLHLQPPREHVDDPRDLAQPDDGLIGDIAHVHFAEEREQVVLAERIHLNVLHDHHAFGVRREERALDDLFQLLPVPRGEERERLRAAPGRLLQSRALGIVADFGEELAEEGFHERAVYRTLL